MKYAMIFVCSCLLIACNQKPSSQDAAVVAEASYDLSVEEFSTGHVYIDTVIQHELDRRKKDFIDIANEPVETAARYALNIEIDSFLFPPSIRSYMLNIYEYTGGAHGNSLIRTFTFDTREQKRVGLSDVFGSFFNDNEQMYALIGRIVMDNLGSRLEDKGWVDEGSGTNPDNYQNFIITEDELVFFFPPYQVAPYSEGTLKVAIPLMALQ